MILATGSLPERLETQIEIASDEVLPSARLLFQMTTDFELKSVAMTPRIPRAAALFHNFEGVVIKNLGAICGDTVKTQNVDFCFQ